MMPRTSEEWFWVIMFGAVLIGAAGGWAYLAHRVIKHVRVRRQDPLPWSDPASTPLDDVIEEWKRLEREALELIHRPYEFTSDPEIFDEHGYISTPGNDAKWFLDLTDDDDDGDDDGGDE